MMCDSFLKLKLDLPHVVFLLFFVCFFLKERI
jgi:hypothetical protein